MNTYVHGAQADGSTAYVTRIGIHARMDLKEGDGRTGTANLFFTSAEDCQAVADELHRLAAKMRELASKEVPA